MMSKSTLIRVFRNEEGIAAAEPLVTDDVRAKYLGRMLSGGIQAYLDETKDLLRQLSALQRGDVDEVSMGGNAYDMIVTKDGAALEMDVFPDDPPLQYSVDEVRDALEDWQNLLGLPHG